MLILNHSSHTLATERNNHSEFDHVIQYERNLKQIDLKLIDLKEAKREIKKKNFK